ncbi:MAG: ABC transporter substrate-binding protein [Deltaproteobacteria bacterium]|nr:MAG: ABC transporter substrate-binding protein [Deltaproteobacteria bacterium]
MKAMKGNGNKIWQVFFVFGLALILLASWGAPTCALEKAKPKYVGILHWWQRGEPVTQDPHRYRQAISYGPSGLIFSQLVRSTMQSLHVVEPDLAKRWEISDDGKVYTFYLYEGVKWHDGKPFTAQDVKYNLERMADPKRAMETSRLFPSLVRAEVVDKYTVKAYLSAPQPSFLPFLTCAYCKILPKHILEAGIDHKSTDWLVGTGPFKMKKHEKGIMYELERYADYHHKGLPYLDGIVNYIIKDPDAQVSALISKRVDMSAPGMAHSTVAEVEAIKTGVPEAIIEGYIAGNAWTLRFCMKKADAPWQDPRVRRAVALVVDQREAMIAATGSDRLCVAGGRLYPFGPYALPEKELASYMGTDKPYDKRVAEAKRVMAEAGFGKGFEATLLIRGRRALNRRQGEMVAEQVRRIGIDLKIEDLERATYLERRVKGQYDWIVEGVESLLGEPDEQVGIWVTDSPFNWSGYSNPKVDKLYRKSTHLTGAERVKTIRDVAREMWADPPSMPLYYYGYAIARWPYVKEFHNPGTLNMNLTLVDKVWLDR